MNSYKGRIKVSTIIETIILIIVLIFTYNFFKDNFFNGFEKATSKKKAEVEFFRDSTEKYSEGRSYKISNLEYNDSSIFKEIEVEPNTPYKIICMAKTQDIQCETEGKEGGFSIGLLDTTEYGEAISGTNDWQRMEFMFNSRNNEKVKISFRLGGNTNNCKGTVWISDFKIIKGVRNTNSKWNVGCFIMKNLNVNIDGKQYNLTINSEDIKNIKSNMERYKNICSNFSNEKIDIDYEINEIDRPINTISYSNEHGNYISYYDVKDLIYPIVKEKKYDHIIIVVRMENDEGDISIPIKENWIGLGSMEMYGIGYSIVRINKNSNDSLYKYGIMNHSPEEIYLHEFLHTLERNSIESGYKIPALHDYEQYGYKEERVDGLNKWYRDYMQKNILDTSTGEYVGLPEEAYTMKPPKDNDFKYGIEIEFNKEPQNLFEEISSLIRFLTKK